MVGNEKLIVYSNVNWKTSWMMRDEPAQTTPKEDYVVISMRL